MACPYWLPRDYDPETVWNWKLRWDAADADLVRMYLDGCYDPPVSCLAPWELLALCARASRTPPGCFVEVGVYRGGSAYQLARVAKAQKREIFLYDTFAGLPYSDPDVDVLLTGQLDTTSEADVRAALGDYPYIEAATFPHVKRAPPAPIAFAHIDVDQYQAHIETCLFLAPLMAPGGIMWFDDVAGAQGGLEGARKAIRELFPAEAIRADVATDRWYVEFL